MKYIFFHLLGILMLMFSSCNKDKSNIEYYEGPAIVKYGSGFTGLQTYSHDLLALPALSSTITLYPGDLIWTIFNIDHDNQPTEGVTMISSDFAYMNVDHSVPASTPGGASTSEYPDAINDIRGYVPLGNYLFFVFMHNDVPLDQTYRYEMTYDSEAEETGIPTVYIRAIVSNTGSKDKTNVAYPYAFYMPSSFLETHKKFNVKYKTGEDTEGNEKWSAYSETVEWPTK